MLYLMVGGPWHGTWKQLDPDEVMRGRYINVPDPIRPPVFERASEFGVPLSSREGGRQAYFLKRFDVMYRWHDLYIDVLVWVGPLVELHHLVSDAFHTAVEYPPAYVPYYRWMRS